MIDFKCCLRIVRLLLFFLASNVFFFLLQSRSEPQIDSALLCAERFCSSGERGQQHSRVFSRHPC
eukprot:SAG22_NODE_143_length_17909_cov_34.254969_18_plen_65_part_00